MSAPQTICPVTGKVNTFLLGDDGTLDTVVYCSECGRETRYNYADDNADEDVLTSTDEVDIRAIYADWVAVICADAAELHMDDSADDTEVTA
jgi:hypothetical protein